MTIKKTVKYFKEMVEGQGAYELCPAYPEHLEMTKIALVALEKQIPQKPTNYYCPCCKSVNIWDGDGDHSKFCGDCGQALDWSFTE